MCVCTEDIITIKLIILGYVWQDVEDMINIRLSLRHIQGALSVFSPVPRPLAPHFVRHPVSKRIKVLYLSVYKCLEDDVII